MNTAQTASDTAPKHIAFYVNMDFSKLANAINSATLPHKFNGKGRKVTYLEDDQEATYFHYSSDSAGKQHLTPPFEINDGDTVTCILQPLNNGDSDNSELKFKWKDILQSRFDLQFEEKNTTKTEVTYKAVATSGATEDDTVIIIIHFKLGADKFSVAWDPRVKVKI